MHILGSIGREGRRRLYEFQVLSRMSTGHDVITRRSYPLDFPRVSLRKLVIIASHRRVARRAEGVCSRRAR